MNREHIINNTEKNTGQPLISIIIPVHNVERYLERCLESVVSQDYSNYEILLIDDGSTDSSGSICDQWQDRGITVYHKANGGLSDARNYGLDRCSGEYISFIDSDDYIKPTYLSYLYRLICCDNRCKVAQANHKIVWERQSVNAYRDDHDYVLSSHDAAEAVLFHDRVDVSAWGKLYHKSVFSSLRYPKGRIFEDTYVFGDVLKQTDIYVWGHVPQYYYVKNNPNSIVNQSFSERNLGYIEAAEKMANTILSIYPNLGPGCTRVINHARLSVLRYMGNCEKKDLAIRENLRQEVLKESNAFFFHARTPYRDRLAILLLKMGYGPFYYAWGVYTKKRNR